MQLDVKYYSSIIGKHLTEKRLKHSVSVCEESVKLARRYGADEDKAALGGILHDITKDVPHDFQLCYCRDKGIALSEADLSSSKLFHAITGASHIRLALGVDDPEVLSAVRCHTTGKGGMSPLDMVLYVADCIEPGRDFDGADYIRAVAYEDLYEAMRRALEVSIAEVSAKGAQPHPDTLEAMESLKAACPAR